MALHHPKLDSPSAQVFPARQPDFRLQKAWGHEFLHIAMMSAFVAMGCNGLAQKGSAAGLAAIEGNIPDEPAVHRAIRQGLLELPEHLESLQGTTQRAYDALAAAIADFRHVQSAPAEQITRRTVESLAARWRETAGLLLLALEHFSKKRLLHPDGLSDNSLEQRCPKHIRRLLGDAIAGSDLEGGVLASVGQEDARVHLPRRRWDRKNVQIPCQVDAKGQSCAATLRNISLGGALLDGVPFLMRGTPMRLTLSCGRVLEAVAMWSRDGSVGARFVQQLMIDDPLMDEPGSALGLR